MAKKISGFSLIEVMFVVVIIAILARITVVAYTGSQARTRDSLRKNDVASLAKQIQIYATQKQAWDGAGCGNGALDGYTTITYGSNKSITGCLTAFDQSNKQLNDPSGCTFMPNDGVTATESPNCKMNIRSAYRAYNIGNHYYIATKLETLGNNQSMITNNVADSATQNSMKATGFNYVVVVR